MRAVVQRVARASVSVEGQTLAAIGQGLLVLLGVGREDAQEDARHLAAKVRDLRLFEEAGAGDGRRRMELAVGAVNGAVLVVSQFTLYGDARKGRRPSFDAAAPPERARALYEAFVAELRAAGLPVETGAFQADMAVELVNDGPVTILLDSHKVF